MAIYIKFYMKYMMNRPLRVLSYLLIIATKSSVPASNGCSSWRRNIYLVINLISVYLSLIFFLSSFFSLTLSLSLVLLFSIIYLFILFAWLRNKISNFIISRFLFSIRQENLWLRCYSSIRGTSKRLRETLYLWLRSK